MSDAIGAILAGGCCGKGGLTQGVTFGELMGILGVAAAIVVALVAAVVVAGRRATGSGQGGEGEASPAPTGGDPRREDRVGTRW